MIRNWVKCATISKIRDSYLSVKNKTCYFSSLNVPSVYNCQQNKFICCNPVQGSVLRPSSCNIFKDYARFKSKDQKSRARKDDSDSEDELEDELEFDDDGNKVRVMRIKSLRVDSVLTKCVGMTRRKVDDLFLGSRFRLNGEPMAKKSIDLKPGDSLEVCSDPVDTGGTTEVVTKINILKVRPADDGTYYNLSFSIDKRK